MQTAIIGTKNQVVIPLEVRKKIRGLKPGQKVDIYSPDDNTVVIKVDKGSWLERGRGLMKNAWKDIDTKAELEKMRNEW